MRHPARYRNGRRRRGEYAVHAYDFTKAASYFNVGNTVWMSPVCKTAIAIGPSEAAVQATKKQVDCLRCRAILEKAA